MTDDDDSRDRHGGLYIATLILSLTAIALVIWYVLTFAGITR